MIILRRIQPDISTIVKRYSCKVTVIVVRFWSNLEFIARVSKKKSSNANFHENPYSGSEVVRRGLKDTTKLTVALHDFANRPKAKRKCFYNKTSRVERTACFCGNELRQHNGILELVLLGVNGCNWVEKREQSKSQHLYVCVTFTHTTHSHTHTHTHTTHSHTTHSHTHTTPTHTHHTHRHTPYTHTHTHTHKHTHTPHKDTHHTLTHTPHSHTHKHNHTLTPHTHPHTQHTHHTHPHLQTQTHTHAHTHF